MDLKVLAVGLSALFLSLLVLALAAILVLSGNGQSDQAETALSENARLIQTGFDEMRAQIDAAENEVSELRTEFRDLLSNQNENAGGDADTLLAWAVLTSGTAGDLGKTQAFAYLLDRLPDERFVGLNLSCPEFSQSNDWCKIRPQIKLLNVEGRNFERMNFSWVDFGGWTLNDVEFRASDLSHARISGWTANKVQFNYVDMQNSYWRWGKLDDLRMLEVDLSNSTLDATRFEGATLQNVIFNNALVEFVGFEGAQLINVSFAGAGLSGARFEGAEIRADVDFTNAWAWEDQMPTGLDPDLITQCVWTPKFMGSSPVRGDPRPTDC